MENYIAHIAITEEVVVFDDVAINHDLVKGFLVHKVEAHVVFIKELVRFAHYAGGDDFVACGEGVLEDTTRAETFHFAANKGVAFAGFYVLELYELEDVVVVFDTKSVSDVCCGSHRGWFDFEGANINSNSQKTRFEGKK